jgi:hypothetical protein
MDIGRLPALSPAAVLVPSVGPLGHQNLELRCINGNLTLLDFFMLGLCHEALPMVGPNLNDGGLDLAVHECWRVAESIVRTRYERYYKTAGGGEKNNVGGAA